MSLTKPSLQRDERSSWRSSWRGRGDLAPTPLQSSRFA